MCFPDDQERRESGEGQRGVFTGLVGMNTYLLGISMKTASLALAIEVELTHVDIRAMRERCEVEEREQGEAVSLSEKLTATGDPSASPHN